MLNPKFPVIGWREFVSIPSLGVKSLRAKIDTGAQTSALHASDIVESFWGNKPIVHFKLSPEPHNPKKILHVRAPLIGTKIIKDSHGRKTRRPVIPVILAMGPYQFRIELTLIDRTDMSFRMLLGRQALKNRFIIYPNKSFLLSRT